MKLLNILQKTTTAFIGSFALVSALVANAVEITSSNSLVNLASLRTNNFTFTDPGSGQSIVVKMTMSPYSSSDPMDVLILLDGGTRLGVGNITNGGDGNWIESGEGVDFTASLVSASTSVNLSSVQFKISGLGTRSHANLNWNSSAGTNLLLSTGGSDSLRVPDTNFASLIGSNYSAQLRLNGQTQLTDTGSLGGKGLLLTVSFTLNANTPPLLTSIATLTGGTEDTAFPVSYDTLSSEGNEADLEGGPISFRVEEVSSGTLKKNGTNILAGSTLLSAGETLSWTPAQNANGTIQAFTVKAWDGALASETAIPVNVTVSPFNDAPYVANPIPLQTVIYGTPVSYTFAENTFADVDSSVFSYFMNMYEGAPVPPGISLDSPTRTFFGTPTNSGNYVAEVRCYDDGSPQRVGYGAIYFNIGKANLVVTPLDVTRAFGQTNPLFSGTISGLKNDDNITATFSTPATSNSAAGTYSIFATLHDPNGRLTNYNLTLAEGTLTITNVPVIAVVDPRTNSWLTTYSGKYARLYQTDAQLAAGTSRTTWTNGNLSQALPAYSGVQEIYSSSNWVYIRTTGLGSHTMGPWYNDATRTTLFPNIALNQKVLIRFPRTPVVPATKVTVGGDIGYFVDGVNGFDSRDAVSYINSTGQDGNPPGGGNSGDGIWNRDAYVNEGITFDPALAHQQNTGVYHYHANPIATRYLLGDHVDFNPVTKSYSESLAPVTKHSPIVGWAKDGFPIYGPYGYSISNNPSSGVRRMIAGFVLRNGQNGTTNLAVTGRTTLPAWAARAGNRSATLVATEYGPAVSSSFPLGRYTEDNDYLGDLGKVLGVDFDLDQYNGRFCVTPEFPNGTYAYFVAISAQGLPIYPYNVGKQYYGTPSGGAVTTISETVTTNFIGGTNMPLNATPVRNGSSMTLVWSSVDGGTYRVESSADLNNWSNKATNILATGISTQTNLSGGAHEFYRVNRTGVAPFDPVSSGTTGGTGITSVAPTSANRGTTFTLTINLSLAVNPPPQAAPVSSVTVGTIAGSNRVHVSQTQVTATISIPAGATPGPQTVTVVFPGPPENPSATVTYTLTNGFTIQ